MLNNSYLSESVCERQPNRKELFKISQKISKNYSPNRPLVKLDNNVSMSLTQAQLLEVSQNINLYYTPRVLSNNSTLALLPIDLEHFYVYWNLADYHQYSHGHQNDDLKLRVYSQCKKTKPKLVYESTVSSMQRQQRINFQKSEKGAIYTASLGKSLDANNFLALLNSNEIYSFYETQKQTKSKNKLPKKVVLSKIDTEQNKPQAVKSRYLSSNRSSKGKTIE
ncbi:MAG: DUF4912 domain-containing protein [Methylococcales symbiont of Hymedesmia sp. n. MRB-2018]|nr:MAG: DUF4912 domain-containing protein [Methylococcales symbiont of Hymedesmia sp. n. MRB-2018]KAF3984504.1 MAG: DUF4912 domain-containing protein [Methylococcales symbiont of Hymedesmia sp. n. MRB-2018]